MQRCHVCDRILRVDLDGGRGQQNVGGRDVAARRAELQRRQPHGHVRDAHRLAVVQQRVDLRVLLHDEAQRGGYACLAQNEDLRGRKMENEVREGESEWYENGMRLG
jgi:hypothetical protein